MERKLFCLFWTTAPPAGRTQLTHIFRVPVPAGCGRLQLQVYDLWKWRSCRSSHLFLVLSNPPVMAKSRPIWPLAHCIFNCQILFAHTVLEHPVCFFCLRLHLLRCHISKYISHSSLVVTKTGIWVKISKSILEFQIKVLDNLGITDW